MTRCSLLAIVCVLCWTPFASGQIRSASDGVIVSVNSLPPVTFLTPQHVVCDSGCGSPPATADETAFVPGTTNVSPVAFVVDEASPDAAPENSYGAARMSLDRFLYTIFPVPQHIICDSGCAAGAPGQQTMASSSPVVIASDQSAVPVSGTFWQATQPVSGTFWQATQPVSGTVAVNNFPASQAVTGTFWQATQPVSGTFWQATQPVSAASLPLPTGATTEATLGTRLASSTFTSSAAASQASLTAGTLAATTTAAALASSTAIVQVLVQNDPDNTVEMLCGNASAQPIQLRPGDGLTFNVTNLDVVFCKTVSGTGTVAYVAR